MVNFKRCHDQIIDGGIELVRWEGSQTPPQSLHESFVQPPPPVKSDVYVNSGGSVRSKACLIYKSGVSSQQELHNIVRIAKVSRLGLVVDSRLIC